MALIGSPVEVTVATPPRGAGAQAGQTFQAQSCRGSFAWGGSPGTATLVYVGIEAPVTVGAMVNFKMGNHFFAGLCKSDTQVNGTTGTLRTLEFIDYREFLAWDYIFGCFNKADVRLVNGVRLKRWKHMYPADYGTYKWTFTNAPLLGWEILQAIFQAPTVGTPWIWDLTSNGLFPLGLLNAPVYDIDCLNGMRLDAVLNLISDKTGLVFCHDPIDTGYLNSDFRLVWTRKGYGLLPLPFPANSDDQRVGASLSGHATNICVLGDRNKYQVLGVEMVKDWSAAWEQFLEVDLLAKDIYDNETNPLNGVRYNAYAAGNAGGADPEHWFGASDAKTRALVITVGEYVAMRNGRTGADGAQFADTRKFAGRWRTDLQAALYIEKLLFRAFKPNISGVVNKAGKLVPLTAAEIADQLLCRVFYDPLDGTMTADTSQPVDGNGVLIAKGYQVGEDLFRLVKPDRMNVNFFDPDQALWSAVNFQIDDSGEGVRFVIADGPVFVGSSDPDHRLLATVDGKVVLNAAYQLVTPPMKAALVFDAERFTYWKGTYPNVSRDRVENVSGLMQEWLVDTGGGYTEIVYANNETANQKADTIAASLLLAQYTYLTGGYNLKWDPKLDLAQFGTPLTTALSSCLDRIEIANGPNGCVEVVDFTTERQRDRFEPERELDRKSIQNSLFPGQQELRVQAEDQRRFNAAVRKMDPKLFTLRKLLRGEIDGNLLPTKFAPGSEPPATLPVGTPIWGDPTKGVATDPSLVVTGVRFIGVTVRHNEGTAWEFPVQNMGDTLALVQGPVAASDPIGFTDGSDFETAGAYLVKGGTPAVGTAQEVISDTSIKTINVRLGAGGGGGGFDITGEYDPNRVYSVKQVAAITMGANAGAYVYINATPSSGHAPYAGGGWWMQWPPSNPMGTWL
jgi:hypothetical protein